MAIDKLRTMDSTSIQRASSSLPSSSSSSLSSRWIYDVFLSFRGEDTRNKFTDHLYHALLQKGLLVFKDDSELERGAKISMELFKAIERSGFSLIIFSRNYASSTWCLDELVKIVECKKQLGQSVVPIFYHVDPSEVRRQTGNFLQAFAKHETVYVNDLEKVQNWRNAMTAVANLSGWHLKDQSEFKFIQNIVEKIFTKVPMPLLSTMKDMIGMDCHLRGLHCCIGIGSNDVRMVGICGMGGIGKTALAKVVHEQICRAFEGNSFLSDVRQASENDCLTHLQTQLLEQILGEQKIRIWNVDYGANVIQKRLCHKRVLLIIDDVNDVEQLEKLAAELDWFGAGSRIIITTRDEHLLVTHGVCKEHIYKPRVLNHDESLQLFCSRAFRKRFPPEDFAKLSEDFVKYACGLPLALEVLGKHLFDKSIQEWKSEFERLKECPKKDVVKILQISFDGLEDKDKEIFLDMACFFNGWYKDSVISILDGCGFNPEIGIRNLIDKSLITIFDGNVLQIHDLLQEMGRNIVRKESRDPAKRTRLWDKQDICDVLTKNDGTEAIEGMMLTSFEPGTVYLSSDVFSKMPRLRLLKIHNACFSNGLEYLPDNLPPLALVSFNNSQAKRLKRV